MTFWRQTLFSKIYQKGEKKIRSHKNLISQVYLTKRVVFNKKWINYDQNISNKEMHSNRKFSTLTIKSTQKRNLNLSVDFQMRIKNAHL